MKSRRKVWGSLDPDSEYLETFRQAETRLWETIGATPSERFVRLRSGGRLRVLEVGHGPPVVFVHGVNVAASSWCLLATALSGFRCVLIDRPGCGLSDPPPEVPFADTATLLHYADDLLATVLDALELDCAHVAATSFGGLFALRGAAKHPDRVDRMVLYSWPMGAPMDRVAISMRIATMPGMRALTPRLPVTRRLVTTVLAQAGLERALDSGAFTDEMLDWTVVLLRDTDTLRNEMRTAPRVVTPIRGVNPSILLTDDTLREVTAPTLFLWGDEDPNGGPSIAEAFVTRLPDATLDIVPRAGHAPWIDELEQCTRRTAEFLTAQALPPAATSPANSREPAICGG